MSIESAVAKIMAARPTFTYRDHVRVRLSGECPRDSAETDGCTGYVFFISDIGDGHDIGVGFEKPHPVVDGVTWWGAHYAPTELELIAAAGAPADEGAC